MDRFLIITNKEKDINLSVTKKIVAYIEKAGKVATLSSVSPVQKTTDPVIVPRQIECAIVLGGDGTIIQAANDLMTYGIPILGVNLGTLGFLAEIEENNVFEALDRLFEDDYRVENRMMIEGDVLFRTPRIDMVEHSTGYALNDAVITRKGFSRIISLGIYVNDELVDNFLGDGVIISTPTGSTAYSLSVGGPIIVPHSKTIAITPVAPHSLNVRPIVICDDWEITLDVESRSHNFLVAIDGSSETCKETTRLTIRRADYSIKVVKRFNHIFFDTLRTKMMWGADSRV